ncbi:hypothetical protein PCANC_18724 [Puccinia coronata f. sp. avenae]|uniref:Uncharacterized protein n=1 Tax=Puccinia coronata f. sp. avenae TaxID=200324 RepID=A0A2N5V0A2_9BASI|nr:hypothetical protein PCANC_18724 [Puccinia coronata f. sp. avenae]PLW43431.1 hypothetical protein PCASD_07536 [Puccinia coronata f. sp. avenae]
MDQPMLFKKLKPLTVPILGMLPIKNPAHSLQLIPTLTSIKAILLDHAQPELMTPPMIHYIFFPFEQLYHQVNLAALSESSLNHLLEISSTLVKASKLHEPNKLWTSKETLMLNSILPILIQKNDAKEPIDTPKSSAWKPARSDESASLALDLMILILYPHFESESTRITLNLDNLYQNSTQLPNLSAYQLQFLFQHLVDILDTLYRIYANPKQSQPSLDRATRTIQLIRLGLLRLSSSNISGGNGVDILSTFLPSITSKLTQLACLLATRRQSSGLLSLTLHTIEWLLVKCLDDELPDLQEIFAANQFQSADCLIDPDQPSESDIYGHVLEIASDWKLGQFQSTRTSSQAATNLSLPASRPDTGAQEILVKRDQSWLRMTSAKVSIVLQKLASCLDNHPSPVVQEAWIHVCSRLLERTRIALRFGSEETSGNLPDPADKDAFAVLVEALIISRSNVNFDVPTHDKINSLFVNVTRLLPLPSIQLVINFIRSNFHSLSNLLVKQASGQDDMIIHLSSRIASSLETIIDLIGHQSHSTQFYQSCFDLIDLNEFQYLSTSILCRVHLIIPKVLDSQTDSGFPSDACSMRERHCNDSKAYPSDRDNLPDTFPKLSVKHIFDHKCIKALEELVRAIFRLVLQCSYLLPSSSIKLSGIAYLDRLLQWTTATKGAKPSDTQQRCLQLNALWTLGESIRASKSISTDDRFRARFRKIEIFCLQGLKKLLEMAESYRIEGGQTQEDKVEESFSSELIGIHQGLENLSVTEYLKGNDQLLELERLRPANLSRRSDELIEEDNFQSLKTCLILRLIASSVHVLEGSFQSNLSWVLYYVLAQLGSPNPYVHQHAMSTVGELALYCSYGSIANMLEDNSDYLIHVVSHQLMPHQYDIYAPFVLEHLIRLVGLRAMLPLVEQILLHDLFELLDDFHGYDLVCEQIIGVFHCVMSLMNQEIVFEQAQRKLGDASNGENSKGTEETETRESANQIDEIFKIEQQLASIRWAFAGPPTDISTDLERFESFQAARSKWAEFQKTSCSSTRGFTEKNPEKPFGEIDAQGSVGGVEGPSVDQETPGPSMTGYQRIAAELMSKSAHFLTHSEVTVRRGVSQLIKEAIPILGSSSASPQESSLLPVIQRFWTIILTRLDDDHTALESLDLLSNLCRHVGTFMSRRLVNDIWPRIRRMIEAEHTPSRVRQAAIESLHTIITYGEQIHWKESFVWDIIQALLTFQSHSKSNYIPIIDQILDVLSGKGFRNSVLVARRATCGLVPAMQFMATTPLPSSASFPTSIRPVSSSSDAPSSSAISSN